MFRKFSRSPNGSLDQESDGIESASSIEGQPRRGSSPSNWPLGHSRELDRRASGASAFSLHSRSQKEYVPSSDPLGLTVVHNPPRTTVDFIFIHGLGGNSKKTWSWNRDPQHFWPAWLPTERELSTVRIFSFGYNADFRGPESASNIIDFAKELLFSLLTYSGDDSAQAGPIGSYLIVFIAHSLGGLVVKKAYILGKSDEQYAHIIVRLYGIVFLATPHRGSSLARTLNYVLSMSPAGTSSKHFIADLEKNSSSLQDINEQFRFLYGNVALVSFYETQKTSLAPGVKKFVVEKDSGVLGLPHETSSPLVADHHTICKFQSPCEANYITVTNVLKMFIARLSKKGPEPTQRRASSATIFRSLEKILAIHDSPDVDFNILRKRLVQGSCRWILKRESFVSWIEGHQPEQNILWLSGLPAVGKSTLASFIIDYLQQTQSEEQCQYYFFLSNDQQKKSVAYFLRMLAFQLAQSNELFRTRLLAWHEDSGMCFGEMKANIIWEKLFEGMLFKMDLGFPLYWIVDALDEADSPSLIANLISKIESVTPIRILLVSRMTQELSIPLHNCAASSSVLEERLSKDDNYHDIQAYVEHVVRQILPGDMMFQKEVTAEVLAKASGSFLWVKLALDSIQYNWHTQGDIRHALTEMPKDMGALYTRMIHNIASQQARSQKMAHKILTWAACALRPLHIAELQQALMPEFGDFVSLEDTTAQICGHFIIVEKSRVSLVHLTARHFLLHETGSLPITISSRSGHNYLAVSCLTFLSNSSWRQVFNSTPDKASNRQTMFHEHPFLAYAIYSWAYHVSLADVESEELHTLIQSFFSIYSLIWINAVALSGDLRTLTRAAQYVKSYIKKRKSKRSQKALQSFELKDDEVLHQWTMDLIRVVGKFGNNLSQNPSSIYKLIPPFCPKNSAISRTFGSSSSSALSVAGLASEGWDDCLARLNVGGDETASRIFCTESYFVTLIASNGTLVFYNADTCEEYLRLKHDEYVTNMAVNGKSNLIVTAGIQTIRLWDIPSGEQVSSFPKADQARIVAVSFGSSDSEVVLGFDDCQVKCYDIFTQSQKWSFLAEEAGDKDHSCPRVMVFSPNRMQVAMAYRGKPVLVWDMTAPGQLPRKCIRMEDRLKNDDDVWNAPEVIRWHSNASHIIILYQDTKLVDWDLVEDEQVEYDHVGAREMACSVDSNFLLTSDHTGTIKIWTFPHFNLIYQLTYNEFVRDLTFSPNAQRFYDVRGSLCNVWEPDALFRPADIERDELSSNYETSEVSEPAIAGDDNSRVQITALACDIEDKYYCCGKEDGTIEIHEMKRGKKLRKLYSHSSTVSIVTLAWSLSSKYIITADDCGRIIAKRLEKPTRQTPTKWAVFPMFDFRGQDEVQQLLFDTTERYVLISRPTSESVWDLMIKREICRRSHEVKSGRKWINHPLRPDLLVWIDPIKIHLYHWNSLEDFTVKEGLPLSHLDHDLPPQDDLNTFAASLGEISLGPMSPSEPLEVVNWVTSTKKGHFVAFEIMLNIGHISARAARRRLHLIPTSELAESKNHARLRQSINGLALHVERLIGSFQDQIVFLDHNYWLCTWEIDSPVDSYKKHFFLPKDWLNADTLNLSALNPHGTLLCPRNGEVAIVRYGIRL